MNIEKTRFTSKKGRRLITGLCIANNGNVVIPREKKKELKTKLYSFTKNTETDRKERERLKGYLAYVKDVEPDFYNRLVLKYSDKITSL